MSRISSFLVASQEHGGMFLPPDNLSLFTVTSISCRLFHFHQIYFKLFLIRVPLCVYGPDCSLFTTALRAAR